MDYVIEFCFKDFNMDGMYLCSVDYVKLMDGFNIFVIELGYFCVIRFFKDIVICFIGNKMLFEYWFYKESNLVGFKVYYICVFYCNGFLEGDYGRFIFLGYFGFC